MDNKVVKSYHREGLHNGEYAEVYNNENVVIKVRKINEYSRVFNRISKAVTDVKILKDGKLYYEIHEIILKYDCEDSISLVGRLKELVAFIENKDITEFKTRSILDDFFRHCKVLPLEIFYNKYRHEKQKEERRLEQFKTNARVQKLSKQLQEKYNKKGYAVNCKGLGIYVIDKEHSTDEVIEEQNDLRYSIMFDGREDRQKQFLYKVIKKPVIEQEFIKILEKELSHL